MRLAMQTEWMSNTYGDEMTLRHMAKAGFNATDWTFSEILLAEHSIWCTDDWKAHADHLKQVGRECGIGFSQAHAPFPYPGKPEPFDSHTMDCIIRSIEAAAYLGADTIVVHPMQHMPYLKNKQYLDDLNLEMYRNLIPYARKFGIRICLENLNQYDENRHVGCIGVCCDPKDFCALVDALDSEWIAACVDVGHSALAGVDPTDLIRALGHDRLKALHIHDVDHLRDCHTIPFLQKLDWDSVTSALAEIDYTGDFALETDNFLYYLPPALRADSLNLIAATGQYLIDMIETKKSLAVG